MRYFVDERTGILAVRDRWYTEPDYPGLHSDTPGIVLVWTGQRLKDKNGLIGWEIPSEKITNAHTYCNQLNEGIRTYTPNETWKQYQCKCGGRIKWGYESSIREVGKCGNCSENHIYMT